MWWNQCGEWLKDGKLNQLFRRDERDFWKLIWTFKFSIELLFVEIAAQEEHSHFQYMRFEIQTMLSCMHCAMTCYFFMQRIVLQVYCQTKEDPKETAELTACLLWWKQEQIQPIFLLCLRSISLEIESSHSSTTPLSVNISYACKSNVATSFPLLIKSFQIFQLIFVNRKFSQQEIINLRNIVLQLCFSFINIV